MRIFVALKIGEKLQKDISEWAKNFDSPHLRWLVGKDLHVTVAPPWDETDIESIKKKLSVVSGVKPFGISFRNITYGPSLRQPRLIWAIGYPPAELLRLRDEVLRVLNRPDDLQFRLHLTLARFDHQLFSQFKIKHLNEHVHWHTEIKSFVLLRSLGYSRYEILAEFYL